MRRLTLPFIALVLGLSGGSDAAELSREAVNGAQFTGESAPEEGPSPLVLKAQILLDRAGASPGAIDGRSGESFAKAVSAFEAMRRLPIDGRLDAVVWSALAAEDSAPVLVEYEVTREDAGYDFIERLPEDYSELAAMKRLGYVSLAEMLAERFHMDVDLLARLAGDRKMEAGSRILVADIRGTSPKGKARRLEADKVKAQLRVYGEEDKLLAVYPASIGSADNPSPSGVHKVRSMAADPVYYYRPQANFQQGDNTEGLELPPGPNNPVGTIWIDLSMPTYGIHGTPEPAEIGKEASHGCVRLTNWDAEELANLVAPGVKVEFVE